MICFFGLVGWIIVRQIGAVFALLDLRSVFVEGEERVCVVSDW